MNAYKCTLARPCLATSYLAERLSFTLDVVYLVSTLRSGTSDTAKANASASFGRLFVPERRDELRRALVETVVEGLSERSQVAGADVIRIVSELIEEAERGAFTQLHMERNDDGSFRAFCTDCERPWCCIVFETIRLTADDAWALSQRFAMSPDLFLRKYCEQYVDETQPDFVYRLKRALPCEFLLGDRCTIYTDRPERCRHFPLQRDQRSENFIIYPWCNYFFNLLRYEATIRVLEYMFQKYHSNQARIRYGGAITTSPIASSARRR